MFFKFSILIVNTLFVNTLDNMLSLSLKKVVQRYEIIDNLQVIKSLFAFFRKKMIKPFLYFKKRFIFARI